VQWALAILYSLAILACSVYALLRLARDEGPAPGSRRVPLTLWLFALAAVARLGFVAVTGRLASPDWYEQEEMALAALAGRGFSYDLLGTEYQAYGPPLFTLFSAAVYGVFGHHQWLLVVADALISATSVPMVHAIGARCFGARAGIVAAALAALHPALLVYAGKLHELSVEVPFATGIVLFAVRWIDRRRWADALALAAFTAVGAMGRPSLLFVAAPIAAWSLWRSERLGADALRVGAAALLAGAMLAPWTLYISGVYGRPIFFNVSGGIVFWYGNNPAATGSGTDPSGRPVFDDVPPDLHARISRTDALSADAALREAAWSYIRDEPAAFLARSAQKLVWFWTVSPNAGALYPPAWRVAYVLYYALMVGLGVVGLRSVRGRWSAAVIVPIASLFLVVSLIQSVFYVDGRHRWVLEPVMLCFTAAGLVAVASRYGPSLSAMSRRWRPSG